MANEVKSFTVCYDRGFPTMTIKAKRLLFEDPYVVFMNGEELVASFERPVYVLRTDIL